MDEQLTPEVMKAVLKHAHMTRIDHVAHAAGVNPKTLHEWLNAGSRGKHSLPMYRDFAARFHQVKAQLRSNIELDAATDEDIKVRLQYIEQQERIYEREAQREERRLEREAVGQHIEGVNFNFKVLTTEKEE